MRAAASDSAIAPDRLLALFAAKDLDGLMDAAFALLGTVVTCDFSTAFYRSTGSGLLKQRDSRGRESGPAFMRRYLELTPALPAAMADRGIKILTTRTLMPLSNTQLEGTAFYREIMQSEGWRHAVALCFWGDPPAEAPVFVTSVYRREGQRDFSDREVATLTRLHPFLDCAVNRVHERDAAKIVSDIAIAPRDGTGGVAILDGSLGLVQANRIARQLCTGWADDVKATHAEGSSLAWRLPAVLAVACQELQREWQALVHADPDVPGLRRQRQAVHPRVPGLAVSITMVCPNTGLGEPTFVIEFNRPVPALQKMTPAERAVATVLADGLSNQEIADQLGKTVDAVKFLLHRIYRKMGVPSRTALVAVLRARSNHSLKHRKQ